MRKYSHIDNADADTICALYMHLINTIFIVIA